MIEFKYTGDELYARMERAVERVNERLRKTVRIMETAQIPYAIVGGYAVRAWVAQVDEAAVRTTRDVDVLVRPEDLPAMIEAMTKARFHHRQTTGLDMFVESSEGSARDAVHVVLAGEMVRPNDVEANPDVEPIEKTAEFQTIEFKALVRMKLNSFRDKDRVHLRDMISLGMVNEHWLSEIPDTLASRLQELLDDPDG